MPKRIIAGTERVSGDGIVINSTTVKEHHVQGQVVFRELVGITLAEQQAGAMQRAKVTWETEDDF